jgi:erythronate-4-phosphate dehydrogenase
MKIIADRDIPLVKEVFSHLGTVEVVAGRRITAGLVRDADILLVRSVTKINEALLSGSSVRFVATSTIGTDHIDREYLDTRQIGFAYAPASNAQLLQSQILLRFEKQSPRDYRCGEYRQARASHGTCSGNAVPV